ncbi:hypothetical protein BV25DRAFT_1922408 [Artomyces pyxidatus]|uniref:Uncharacterized protein n=1 Tax=Artomyces pyxidatus TaxID=48021 RepID=A0ACB8SEU6_9AGAM|nr:hypothetical protein BV25DRAFT_1922408 [Artomyces pyxidatus]
MLYDHIGNPIPPYELINPYRDLEMAVAELGLQSKVRTLSEWDDREAGILSILKLAQALGIHDGVSLTDVTEGVVDASTPSPFEWRGNTITDGRVNQHLHYIDQDTPLRIWMVGVLDEADLQNFCFYPGSVYTTMRPLFQDSWLSANAVLSHFTTEDDKRFFDWYERNDSIRAWDNTTDGLYRMAYNDRDELSVLRRTLFPIDRLFDGQFVDNPLESHTFFSDHHFHDGDLVLQECLLTRSLRPPETTASASLQLRYVYRLFPGVLP